MSGVKAFVIVQIAINDRDGYHQYEIAGHQEIFDRFSGKVVGLDENVEIVEGSWPCTRTVLIEFDSVEAARAAHDGPAYQEALAALAGGADREIRIVEGV